MEMGGDGSIHDVRRDKQAGDGKRKKICATDGQTSRRRTKISRTMVLKAGVCRRLAELACTLSVRSLKLVSK